MTSEPMDLNRWLPSPPSERRSQREEPSGTSEHLTILYELARGMNARTILEIGIGQTTPVLRAAARDCGGILYSCDSDKRRYSELLAGQDDHWRLFLDYSHRFIERVPGPFDLVLHDGAHDYESVRRDLALLLPKMKRFGLICVHDTQEPDLYESMTNAIRDATRPYSVSWTTLPFSAGLTLMRIEESANPPIQPRTGRLPDGRVETELGPFPSVCSSAQRDGKSARSLQTVSSAVRIRVAHWLRQMGLRD